MSWFEDWFDSPLYEKLYSHRNQKEAAQLAQLIKQELPVDQFTRLLDLGCGRGRHSITLAKLGYKVMGVDLSEEAISKARQIAKHENIKHITFRLGDMRDPLPDTFDAVVNLFTTFGYFKNDHENVRVLRNVSRMLRIKGVFVQDFLNRTFVEETLIPSEEGAFQGVHYNIERKIEHDIEHDMVIKTIYFTGPSLNEPVEYEERVKLYDLAWFEKELPNYGLDLKKIYGNYDGSPFEKSSSPRMIMFSQKPG